LAENRPEGFVEKDTVEVINLPPSGIFDGTLRIKAAVSVCCPEKS
jgi:hypothetical protein